VIDRDSGEEISSHRTDDRVVRLAGTIGYWRNRHPDRYKELKDLGRRMGVLQHVDVKIYEDPSPSTQRRDLAWISVDDVNIGLLSDGTLRVLETLVDLIDPSATILFIEEPETGVHPGLLRRLLAEIDAYTSDRQVVISTHSPLVVDWAKPSDLRLVERLDGKTTVRALADQEVAYVGAYLNDEGTLAEYVFGRSDE